MQKREKFATDTLVQNCYDQLQSDIITGTLKPGQKLKIETLKELFKVGQSPLREALSRLVAGGLVETQSNKGFYVATLSESDIRDIYRTFTQIENVALAQAIERGDEKWESSVVAALYQLSLIERKKQPVPYSIWAEKNYAFHVALISGCNSPTLLKIRHDLYVKFDRYCRIAYNLAKEELALNNEEHTKLAHAVLQRNAKEAHALMNHHINGALEGVIITLKENEII